MKIKDVLLLSIIIFLVVIIALGITIVLTNYEPFKEILFNKSQMLIMLFIIFIFCFVTQNKEKE